MKEALGLPMVAFVAGNTLDTLMTHLYTNQGASEIGIVGSQFFAAGELDKVMLAKMTLVASIVGIRLLSELRDEEKGGIRWRFVSHNSMKIGNYFLWAALTWNSGNIILGHFIS